MPGEFLIENARNRYAISYISWMHRRFGWRAIIFYTDGAPLPHGCTEAVELVAEEFVSARYEVQSGGMAAFRDHLRVHHDVRAVVPYDDANLLKVSWLAAELGLDWAQHEVIRRFRDKMAFKAHLRLVDPDLRLNRSSLVNSAAEALTLVREWGMSRFVLKPNDGSSNINIGIFSADTEESSVTEFWRRAGHTVMALEDYIGGEEFHCNGQAGVGEEVYVFDIYRYIYRTGNGREILRAGKEQVRSTDPVFGVIEAYACRVIRASGLSRCPFHMEIKVDERGVCLIECAARFVGWLAAYHAPDMFGSHMDYFAIATHFLGTASPIEPEAVRVDRQVYDRELIRWVVGWTERSSYLVELSGVSDVEALEEFWAWQDKPKIGDYCHQTDSLRLVPYVVLLRSASAERLAVAAAKVDSILRLNDPEPSAWAWRKFHFWRRVRKLLKRIRPKSGPQIDPKPAGCFS